MPGSVGRTNSASATRFPAPVERAVANVAKKLDQRIQGLDSNRDGKITEAEFAPFMRAFEQASARGDQGWGSAPPARTGMREQLDASRATMTDAERLDMVIAQGLQKLPQDASTIAVKDLKKFSRQALNELTQQATTRPDGGLMSGLGFLMAATILPDEIFNAAMR